MHWWKMEKNKNRGFQKHVLLFNANLLGDNRMHVIDAKAFPSLSLFPYSIFTFFCNSFSSYQTPNNFAITFASAFFGTTKILVTFLIFSGTLSITTTLHSCKIWFGFFAWNINTLIILHLHSQICTENGIDFQFLTTWATVLKKKLGQL